MKPIQVIEMVLDAGGQLALIDGKLKGRGLDNNTRPLVKKHRAEIISLLALQEQKGGIPVVPEVIPCSICGGRDFIHGNKGGYFCKVCQPGIVGKPVRAGGNRTETEIQDDGAGRRIREPLPPSFIKAAKWLLEHRQQLYQHGWTPGQLFRRNRSCGLAWVYIWGKPDLEVSISESGAIKFTFSNTAGRIIQQTAIPRAGIAGNRSSRR